MDLKIPEQWLEFPEDVESTEIIPHRTSSTEDFETDAADLPYEDHDQFEFDRDINIPTAATSAAAAHLDNDEILLIEVPYALEQLIRTTTTSKQASKKRPKEKFSPITSISKSPEKTVRAQSKKAGRGRP
uniref:Uncharacterized protein n=1 Tax=Anopheles arabiensis TaxID=7173 RepID=A0A182HZ51_ANOAR